jgi:hypothetical protein
MKSLIKLELPEADADAFAEKLKGWLEEHVPRGLFRAGTIAEVRIFRGSHTNSHRSFLLLGEMTGPVGMLEILGRDAFAPLGATATDLGDYSELDGWKAEPA